MGYATFSCSLFWLPQEYVGPRNGPTQGTVLRLNRVALSVHTVYVQTASSLLKVCAHSVASLPLVSVPELSVSQEFSALTSEVRFSGRKSSLGFWQKLNLSFSVLLPQLHLNSQL
jgi:hypothetical protein